MHVTVVIPTYNRLNLLKGAIEAIQSQTHDEFDLVIVDDGSTESQRTWLRDLSNRNEGIYTIFQKNSGPAAARNRGWREAEGEIVAFTDDDCRPPTDWLKRFVDAYQSNPGVGGVGSYIGPPASVADSNPYARYHRYMNEVVYAMPEDPVVGGADLHVGGTGSMSYRRSVLEEVGGFDEGFPMAAGEDAELQERVAAAGYEFVLLPMKVEHVQTYSLTQFVEESVRRGRGLRHFHRVHGGARHPVRILAGLVGAPLMAVDTLRTTQDIRLAGLSVLAHALNRLGEFDEAIRG